MCEWLGHCNLWLLWDLFFKCGFITAHLLILISPPCTSDKASEWKYLNISFEVILCIFLILKYILRTG